MNRIRSLKKHYVVVVALLIGLVHPGLSRTEELSPETVSVDSERMIRFLVSEAKILGSEARERIRTKAKLDSERSKLRKEFRFMLGLEPLPERTPLHITHVRTIDRAEYTIDVVHFQSLPGFYVTANIYKPNAGKAPYPAVIWGPGHSNHPNGAKALRQLYAIPWVRDGYICMMIDPIQVAEVYGVHRGTHSWDRYDWFARGYTPAGIEVWNAMRAVDYLLTRSDVDSDRLTINGVSGGGHLSWMTGAADERITVVQPVAGTADVQAHVELDLQRRHCDCAYFINTYRHDWPTLAALICPRPLLMHNSSEDGYYPPEGYTRVLERAQEIYANSGAPGRTAMFEVPGHHGYFQSQREKAVEWSNRWLFNRDTTVKEHPFDEVPGEQLAALDGKTPENAINDRIHELLIPAASLNLPVTKRGWEERVGGVMKDLTSVVFRNMPITRSGRKVTDTGNGGFVIETEPGILIGMSEYIPGGAGDKHPSLIYIASPGDTESSAWNFLRTYPYLDDSTGRYIVYPRGIGTALWDGTQRRRFERSAMLLGRTVDSMRLYDILCAVDYVTSLPGYDGETLTIVGKGVQGVLGTYAAILDERISRVILHSPSLSHTNGPTFLNILRYTDIPEALAMLAPRDLVFLTPDIERFSFTRDIYSLVGAKDNFRRAQTVTQVLNSDR
ncbi:prolyl oligopeptidase family serine peptidase [Candidatus Latescibacterota bacterium]